MRSTTPLYMSGIHWCTNLLPLCLEMPQLARKDSGREIQASAEGSTTMAQDESQEPKDPEGAREAHQRRTWRPKTQKEVEQNRQHQRRYREQQKVSGDRPRALMLMLKLFAQSREKQEYSWLQPVLLKGGYRLLLQGREECFPTPAWPHQEQFQVIQCRQARYALSE